MFETDQNYLLPDHLLLLPTKPSGCLNAKSVHVSDQSPVDTAISKSISRKLTTFISVNAIPSLLILFTFQLPSCSFWPSIIFSGLVRGV